MIQITRHTDGFTISAFPDEIILLVFDNTFWYSQTKYYGHCSVGTPTADATAAGFQTQSDVDSFIASNNLLKYGVPIAAFHEEKIYQIFMTYEQSSRLSEDVPEMAMYRKANNIALHREREGVYMYLNFWEEGHRELLSQYSTITDKPIS
jgi:hypothetical protein